jgi:hypothetical protein
LFIYFVHACFRCAGIISNVIHGKILDFDTYQPLSGVDITVETTTEGTISNSKGEFTLITKLRKGKLIISHLGYQKKWLISKQLRNYYSITRNFLKTFGHQSFAY